MISALFGPFEVVEDVGKILKCGDYIIQIQVGENSHVYIQMHLAHVEEFK